ncbi:ATP-binding protein [Streptomyces colonosanans]|uniref:Histidine kinase/HSP90-like ATPase domain-containing protein n=1 Tax=Streptomyces colonosanans TaxID=1428652 RepID=A0A1S2NY62_9ACTN|nr:ATP-binding protein [Streptomyces colonosanans]OIJ86417.1 hypothetical protein BIV24_26530 [Streptomyces colonosanans]
MTSLVGTGSCHYEQRLTADPKRIGDVRRIVTAYLRYWGWGELVDPAAMCVTELLSNVSRHANSDECVLHLETSDTGVRIVVSDDTPTVPVVLEPDCFSDSGRGMFLLSETADAWGVVPTDKGKDVWVEIGPASEEVATL